MKIKEFKRMPRNFTTYKLMHTSMLERRAKTVRFTFLRRYKFHFPICDTMHIVLV